MHTQQRAKVFRNGRSQAVRIPAEYRFNTDHVYLEYDPEKGMLLLSEKPLRASPGETLREIFQEFDEAGVADFRLERLFSPMPDRVRF